MQLSAEILDRYDDIAKRVVSEGWTEALQKECKELVFETPIDNYADVIARQKEIEADAYRDNGCNENFYPNYPIMNSDEMIAESCAYDAAYDQMAMESELDSVIRPWDTYVRMVKSVNNLDKTYNECDIYDNYYVNDLLEYKRDKLAEESKSGSVYIDGISNKLVKPHSKNEKLTVVGVPFGTSFASLVVFNNQVFDDKYNKGCKSLKLDADKSYNLMYDGNVINANGYAIKEVFSIARENYKSGIQSQSDDYDEKLVESVDEFEV